MQIVDQQHQFTHVVFSLPQISTNASFEFEKIDEPIWYNQHDNGNVVLEDNSQSSFP